LPSLKLPKDRSSRGPLAVPPARRMAKTNYFKSQAYWIKSLTALECLVAGEIFPANRVSISQIDEEA